MFKKRTDAIENIDSLIGENIKIIGKIQGNGNLRIDGKVEGDIEYNGNIVVGETGTVHGNISCGEISVAGTVRGNVSSNSKLILLPTGSLRGDLEVASFIVHEDAIFDGNCKMSNHKVREIHPKEIASQEN
ncbi:MAG: polymer-forming cytoskeletal protein [Epulopiscium sp.]|nr:polymer-forming cytoskeletal protein [Candidatus Epulonipiscium sp.]